MQKQVDVLNKVLNGEHMAIDTYSTVLNKIDNQILKEQLQKILHQHKKHAMDLSERIQDIGGKIDENLVLKGWLTETSLKIQCYSNINVIDALMILYNGEDKGISTTEELLKHLDEKNKELVQTNLSEDSDHLMILEGIISQIKGKQLH
ncbi:MAG: ferritin-like domain-containing protein [Firmicutes bacterium]|nr:ferritin-like domain-containing protein [Bacillota bacterium]